MQLPGQPFYPAADRGFMHIEGTCNLQERLVVKKICCKQKAVLCSEFVDGLLKPFSQYLDVLRDRCSLAGAGQSTPSIGASRRVRL